MVSYSSVSSYKSFTLSHAQPQDKHVGAADLRETVQQLCHRLGEVQVLASQFCCKAVNHLQV